MKITDCAIKSISTVNEDTSLYRPSDGLVKPFTYIYHVTLEDGREFEGPLTDSSHVTYTDKQYANVVINLMTEKGEVSIEGRMYDIR